MSFVNVENVKWASLTINIEPSKPHPCEPPCHMTRRRRCGRPRLPLKLRFLPVLLCAGPRWQRLRMRSVHCLTFNFLNAPSGYLTRCPARCHTWQWECTYTLKIAAVDVETLKWRHSIGLVCVSGKWFYFWLVLISCVLFLVSLDHTEDCFSVCYFKTPDRPITSSLSDTVYVCAAFSHYLDSQEPLGCVCTPINWVCMFCSAAPAH